MTHLPAQRLALTRRGRINIVHIADILVFNPINLQEHSTFATPHQYSTGIDHILINGKPAIAEGKVTGDLHGRVLRTEKS
jgi:N-acyl-D-aspartate/D-glutamate deacylase